MTTTPALADFLETRKADGKIDGVFCGLTVAAQKERYPSDCSGVHFFNRRRRNGILEKWRIGETEYSVAVG